MLAATPNTVERMSYFVFIAGMMHFFKYPSREESAASENAVYLLIAS